MLALGNLDPCVHFAILSDFADTATPDAPGDAAILDARAGGRRGAQPQVRRRPRRPLLPVPSRPAVERRASRRGSAGSASAARSRSSTGCCAAPTDTSFSTQVGELDVLPSIRYCITLDSDTRLPRDAAKRLIGIIAHPLNRPRFDPRLGRVTEGYGILQPRVSVTMASAAGSLFARTYAGHTGVDPYTTAVSDVYQDLFDEGIFTGKGLYDVDAFAAALDGPRAGERAAVARPVRGALRAHGARHRHRGRGRLSLERARPRAAAAPLGPRRLADPVVAVSVRAVARPASRAIACRSSRAGRSSTISAAAWCRRPRCSCSSSAGSCCRAIRSRGPRSRSRRSRFPPLRCACSRCSAARGRTVVGRVPARDRRRSADGAGARRPAAHVHGQRGQRDACTRSAITLVRLGVTRRRLLEWETTAASAARGGPRAACARS